MESKKTTARTCAQHDKTLRAFYTTARTNANGEHLGYVTKRTYTPENDANQ